MMIHWNSLSLNGRTEKNIKGKRNQRHATWKAKAAVAADRAMSIGKSVLSGHARGFVYPVSESDDSES